MEIKTRHDNITQDIRFISVVNHNYADSITHQLIGGFYGHKDYDYKPTFGIWVGQWRIKYKSK